MTYPTITEINVDLDGVMVDFREKALRIAGFVPDQFMGQPNEKQMKRQFWALISTHVRAGRPYFADMHPMEDAFVLWNYLQELDVPKFICTATGNLPGAGDDKYDWVTRHLGANVAAVARIVRSGVDKAQYATPTTVLIDDRMKVITPWVEAGGIGIFHTSATSTITKLKELGL